MAEANGARLTIESAAGGGTRATISFKEGSRSAVVKGAD
jgi:hypothetical protein